MCVCVCVLSGLVCQINQGVIKVVSMNAGCEEGVVAD